MKFTTYLIGVMTGTALAYLGMGNLMAELAKKQATAPANATVQMVGDLIQGATTPVGNEVKDYLIGTVSCQNLTPKVNTSKGIRSE
jgi:hypothetical protein